jgi:hypothetical protein
MRRTFGLLVAMTLAACAGLPQDTPPSTAQAPAPLSDMRLPADAPAPAVRRTQAIPPALTYRAILIAGSDDTKAFDNGTERMRDLLIRSGLSRPEDITRFTSIPGTEGAEAADAVTILRRIAALKPADDQACLVFFTSHGLPRRGLVVMTSRQMVGPEVLDRAVANGCGDRPALLILSGCFSGVFAQQPMTRPNRTILTAARHDRPSFGCGAKDQYTYFDACLFDSLAGGSTWPAVFDATTACVEAKEAERRYDPSHPRAWFGAEATAMPIPAPAGPAPTSGAATAAPGTS